MPLSSLVPTGHRQTQACGAAWRQGSRSISWAGRVRTELDLVTVGQQEVLGDGLARGLPQPGGGSRVCQLGPGAHSSPCLLQLN